MKQLKDKEEQNFEYIKSIENNLKKSINFLKKFKMMSFTSTKRAHCFEKTARNETIPPQWQTKTENDK